jgi:hypothetical protein
MYPSCRGISVLAVHIVAEIPVVILQYRGFSIFTGYPDISSTHVLDPAGIHWT